MERQGCLYPVTFMGGQGRMEMLQKMAAMELPGGPERATLHIAGYRPSSPGIVLQTVRAEACEEAMAVDLALAVYKGDVTEAEVILLRDVLYALGVFGEYGGLAPMVCAKMAVA